MIVKLDSRIKSLNGMVLQDIDRNGNIQGDITIKSIIVEALLRPHPSEDKLSGMERMKRFSLAQKVYGSKEEVELMVEEIALIKELVGIKNFPVLIVGRTFNILEGKE